jgi:hypothetical protein
MARPMIRKQVYLEREQERKLKALAARRGCTEAEIIREALDRLSDPDRSVEEQLAATGLLVPKRDDPAAPRGPAARTLEAEVEAWLAARPTSLGLSEAILEDRSGR